MGRHARKGRLASIRLPLDNGTGEGSAQILMAGGALYCCCDTRSVEAWFSGLQSTLYIGTGLEGHNFGAWV